jgi:hypothetical protein
LGVFLPLIAVNCAILGASLFMVERQYTFTESVVFGVGSGSGWISRLLAGGRIQVTEIHQERNPFFGGVNPEPIRPNVDEALAMIAGGGYDLGPDLGFKPVNKYLPPRPRRDGPDLAPAPAEAEEALDPAALPPILRWLDRVLSR